MEDKIYPVDQFHTVPWDKIDFDKNAAWGIDNNRNLVIYLVHYDLSQETWIAPKSFKKMIENVELASRNKLRNDIKSLINIK